MPRKSSELRVGEKIIFGSYSVEGETPHPIRWLKASSDGDFIAENIEDFRAFDAQEPSNPNRNRRSWGNNRYSVSNIDQFLNSDEDQWYHRKHDYDEMPTDSTVRGTSGYYAHSGFLANFTSEEKDAILETDIEVAIPLCDGETRSEIITRKVYLPSISNIYGRRVRDCHEGHRWELFTDGTCVAVPTQEATEHTNLDDPPSPGQPWYYLLRSPVAEDACSVRFVGRGGGGGCCSACNGVLGLRPALRINPQILISDKPDDLGYYYQIQEDLEPVDMDEFFAMLRS